MISLSPLIAALRIKPDGFVGDWFRQVDGVAEYAAITKDSVLPMPCAWLVRMNDNAKHAGERAEDVTVVFDVIMGITHTRSHSPGDGDDRMLAYRRAVKRVLLGRRLAESDPIKYGGGSLWDATNGSIFWRDRYQFSVFIDNYLPDPPLFADLIYTGPDL